MSAIPFLLLGDGPTEPTGLGRIARDLAAILQELPIQLVQVGGPSLPPFRAWEHYPLTEADRGEDWGAAYVSELYRWRFGRQPGILLAVWDPARLYSYLGADLPVQRWAYTAIDSSNAYGSVGGPAREALAHFDRVLAYGRYGSEIIRTIRDRVSYLPHGLVLSTFSTRATADEWDWAWSVIGAYRGKRLLIGAVMANQPRKDFGLFFHTLGTLRDRGLKVHGWLHTDVLVKAWAVQQLVEDFSLRKQITVTTDQFSDRELAVLYQQCDCTILPSLGEGFGYPICESLAAGVPVVHGDFGGGAELLPKREWRFPVREVRLDSVYAMKRPVFRAEDAANAIERALGWQQQAGAAAIPYLQGAVAHLDWSQLRGRWLSWIRQGLDA
jgi:glycosyltransferase involved in cell wall biosynthesis